MNRTLLSPRVWAVGAPLAVACLLTPFRETVAGTSMALVLVLVVVAVAVRGDRVAGLLASVVAAASFDFFLSVPYLRFDILDPVDVETAVLLVAVGVAVTELAQWGRRELDRAVRREGYLAGVAEAARLAGEGTDPAALAATVERMITDLLDLDTCRFDPAPARPDHPRVHTDGSVTWNGHPVDVDRDGLPTMDVIELPARDGAGVFRLVAATHVARPTLEQRRVAVTLAEQVGPHPTIDSPDTVA
ncbi:DUF4118 domain-containing protein [Pseudonocardia xishanensis]|uniref:Sensor protein KdpD transmembrane domain-containing protein n=1 Tax=Pseudonocardia xishanensis TaxID=630995 RepID=A0ABP8S2W3_9PSEU